MSDFGPEWVFTPDALAMVAARFGEAEAKRRILAALQSGELRSRGTPVPGGFNRIHFERSGLVALMGKLDA